MCTALEALIWKIGFSASRLQFFTPTISTVNVSVGRNVIGILREPTCTRTFGPACLAHYFPRGCGGRNPVQMLKDYQLQTARLRLLHQYTRVLTNSNYIAR